MIKEVANPKLKNPIFIACWPGMGEVAYKAGLFLKEALEFKLLAKIEASDFFHPAGVVVDKGVIGMPDMAAGFFYYYKVKKSRANDIILFIGEAQPPLDRAEQFSQAIFEYVKKFKIRLTLSFAAMPLAIDHLKDSQVWVAATDRTVLNRFSFYNLKVLSQGQISGLNGLILGESKRRKIKGACLLGEIPLYTVQIENPKASAAILKVIDSFLGLNLNLQPLLERARFIEEEIEKLISYLKGETTGEKPPLTDREIEKIKKDLAAYTKLPESARQKIEELFKEAARDIGKASLLKQELDRWNVYAEYEDRFLDLFKKKKKKNSH